MLKSIIIKFWMNEIVPNEWNIGRLIFYLRKDIYHCQRITEELYYLKLHIIAIILHTRLLSIEESLDHKSHCSFRPGRGCIDTIFTTKMALKKRQEHGLESRVLFLDLVKAFNCVPREMLWKILAKFGVPNKLISLLKVLHANFVIKFTINDVT